MNDYLLNFHNVDGIALDLTPRCTLLCSKCGRQDEAHFSKVRPALSEVTMDDFYKLVNHFKRIEYCGPNGDAVLHPKFIEMLEYNYINNNKVQVANAVSHKTERWYTEAFKANKDAFWVFGIDGLPKDSHKYRINQDGEHLFNMMLLAKKHNIKVQWQYIIFKYNQDYIDKAKEIAKKFEIDIRFLKSKRFEKNDPLRPDDKYVNTFFEKSKTIADTILPKCLHKLADFGHTSQGYIVPCCWFAMYNVTDKYPDLCNENTKISNVEKISDIFHTEGWVNHLEMLNSSSKKLPQKCWDKCSLGTPLSKTEFK